MKTLFTILILLTAFNIVPAQVTQEWVARYNGPGNLSDLANSITVDGSGNVYVTGSSPGIGTDYDYATIKYNSSGVPQWEQRYNAPGFTDDFAYSIALDGTGNVYVTGAVVGGSGTEVDYATIRYNSSGMQQWVIRYNGPGNDQDYAKKIAVDGSGNVYVTGYSRGSGTNFDYATIKYNSSGDSIWVRRYNGPGNSYDLANSIAVDGTGNVYVTGVSRGDITSDDYATIKYNSSGDSIWVQRYNGPGNGNDYARSIAVDGTGNVYVTGESRGNGSGYDYATIKYNSSGIQQWIQRYNGLGNLDDNAYSIAVDGSGNSYVTGGSAGSGTANDFATIKYNSSGDSVWVKRYNGPENLGDGANSIAVDGSSNIYVTGVSTGSVSGYDYATIKYNSSGDLVWEQKYIGFGTDVAASIAVDGSGNVYVNGSSTGNGTGDDYATIKYSQPNGIRQISSIVPEQFSFSQNYPNPFNPSTKINFEISKSSHAKLFVYDLLGKVVANLADEKFQPGTYEVEFDGSRLSSGIYFYRIETELFSETKKMLLIK